MDFNTVISKYKVSEYKELSQKPDSGVYLMSRGEEDCFVLRIYSHEMPVYEMLKKQGYKGFPQVYDCRWEDEFFVVEEQFVDGVFLQEMIDGGEKMDEKRAMNITAKTCNALDLLHRSGFIHRDVKPEHVMMNQQGEIFLIDLDAAMRIEPGKRNDTRVLGTAGYAAPEQFGLTRSDIRTDIYAVGILLNTLLTGQHPAVLRYRNGGAEKIIQKCTEMNPMDRYQDMTELCYAISREELKDTSEEAGTTVKRKKWILLCVIALVVGVAVIIGIGLDGNRNDSHSEMNRAENGELQLHLAGAQGETLLYNSRAGSQCLPMYTEDGVSVDDTWTVYADESIGRITGYEKEWLGWRLDSSQMETGVDGFVHAEKNGEKYAVRVMVTADPVSAYSAQPDFNKMAENWLKPTWDASDEVTAVRIDYKAADKVTLYLASTIEFEGSDPICDDDRVTIEPCEKENSWPNNEIYKMTFYNPDGGDALIQVGHNYGRLTFKFSEK